MSVFFALFAALALKKALLTTKSDGRYAVIPLL